MSVYNQRSSGFTIVELLIVVVVIAILAAITIVSYNGITNQARQAATKAAVQQAAEKITTAQLRGSGAYPATLSELSLGDTSSALYTYIVNNDTAPRNYCLSVTDASRESISYAVTSTSRGVVEGKCVTNLAKDPRATALTTAGQGRWSNDRWGSDGTYSLLTGLNDAPNGVATGVRVVQKSTGTQRNSHGFHFANNTQVASPDGGTGWSSLLPVAGNTTYTASAYIRTSDTARTFGIQLKCASSQTTWSTSGTGAYTMLSQNTWGRVSVTYTTSPDCVAVAGITTQTGGGVALAVGQSVDGTGLMINEGGLYSYGDGDSPGWFWNGTPNNSTSTGPAVLQ